MGGENPIFHPSYILPVGYSDFIDNRHHQPPEDISGDNPPPLMEEDFVSSVNGRVYERSEIDIHIVPKHPQGGTDTIATQENLINIVELFGGEQAINSTYIHAPYAEQIAKAKIVGVNSQDIDSVKTTLGHPSFNQFANQAYTTERGYAIRVNPLTGQKEMFIAGTRNQQDWASNLLEISPHGTKLLGNHLYTFGIDLEDQWTDHASPWRKRAQSYYEQVALDEHVDIIYGHSRGGAIVADMQVSDDIQKVGLDAAMIIADNKDMINYYEAGEGSGRGWTWVKSRFDAGIGLTGKNNKHLNLSKKFHHVWGD